ncbi:MAG: hypothetical protein OEP45_13735 [Acidobacteriota bacterium]|nr:hypothetical protein [Acidobacteriota bacterium]
MRLSAFDCTARGIANLRGNWELALLQIAQMVVFWVLTAAAVAASVAATGATFLLEMASPSDWTRALERLAGWSPSPGSMAVGAAALVIFSTLVALVYGWFQAGIFSTLERGERQAPPLPRADWTVFRTFRWREFVGWSNRWIWRYFVFFGWFFVVTSVVLLFVALLGGAVAVALSRAGGAAAVALGCAALFCVAGVVLGLVLWLGIAQALLPREELGVLGASRAAFGILRRRSPAATLILLFFVLANLGVGLLFWPLSEGMSFAMDGFGAASVAIQLLLGAAQMLAASILTIAFYGSIVSLARAELGRRVA